MRPFLAAAAAALLFTSGCGYIAGTLAPLSNVPGTPQDLAAIQRGSTLIAHFTLPVLTTELSPIEQGTLTLDLRAGTPPNPWNQSEWESKAQRVKPHGLVNVPPVSRKSQETQVADYQFSCAAWANQDVVLAARVIGSNGKPSNWTPLLTLHIIAPLPQPADLKATPIANGVRLTWSGAGDHFHVLRHIEGEAFTPLADATAAEYLDTTAEYGKTYSYQVLAFSSAAPHQEAQSDLSAEAKVQYKDLFPPAVPAGVRASPSPSSIELSWDANAESDLAGYRVYRSVNGASFEKLADVNEIPAYSDRAVEQGKMYRYAITAIDKSGNESDRSAPVAASLQ